ncbi:DUF1499 domain-containing protein [Mechercharimyces sp. CAU 1602]|nr:DUF1499 domain-containing protein [Mechercharimyces sp. CAU 1602]
MLTVIVTLLVLLAIGWLILYQTGLGKRPPNLGVKNGQLAPCPNKPNCVSTQAEEDSHAIKPIPYSSSQQEAEERLLKVLHAMKRMEIITHQQGYVHVESTSLLMRYVDDLEFYFDDDTKVIHFRSASRVGYSDMGVNRKRMESIRAEFVKN